jgi:hypothetical protein
VTFGGYKTKLNFIVLYILHPSILLHCIVQWVLLVMFPSARGFIVLVFIVSLYVSIYMAIFKCVGYFIFICLKDSVSLLFSAEKHNLQYPLKIEFISQFSACYPSTKLNFNEL